MHIIFRLLLLLPMLTCVLPAHCQEDIWKQVDLENVEYKKAKNYIVRLYCYYRFTEDGKSYVADREDRIYRIFEGICSIDIRYGRNEDDGAQVIVARNLVHPDRSGSFMDYYELKPYTFLEKAWQDPKRYSMQTLGDTTRVFTKHGLAGTAVRDTLRHELTINYNALAPDTAHTINLLIAKGHLSHVDCEAVYHLDDNEIDYVPQGNLKHIVFDGDMFVKAMAGVSINMADYKNDGNTADGIRQDYHMHTEIYVDSVAYMTRDEFRASQKAADRKQEQPNTYTDADIDRLRKKHNVPPLTAIQQQRMEEQRDWEDQRELWIATDRLMKTINKTTKNK